MKSERLWNWLAGNWDKPGVGLGENDIRIIEKTRKYLNAGSTVLDYGCATGSICLELAKTVKEVHGLDISSNMIELARRKAVEQNRKNTTFLRGTIFNEALKKESYDVIMALNVLHLVEDTPVVLGRIHSLLKPEGVFISVTPCLGGKNIMSVLIKAAISLLHIAGILPKVNFFTLSKLTDAIAHAGLQTSGNTVISGSMVKETFIASKKARSH